MKLSIIIPVYKVEKYIRHCIESCVNQDVSKQDYEIIAVNDGSPDNCLSILTELCRTVDNMRVISQENSGLSVARNIGLSVAKGEYVWFIDSDDYIDNNVLGDILRLLVDDLDILQIQYRLVYENGSESIDGPSLSINGKMTGRQVITSDLWHVPAQFAIYRRKFLTDNKLDFYPGIYHEDVDFKPRALVSACNVQSFDRIIYNYLQREGSITSKKGYKHIEDLFLISNRLYNLAFNEDNDDLKPYLSTIISCNINWILIIIDNIPSELKIDVYKNLKRNRHLINAMTNSSVRRYKYEGYLLKLHLKLGRLLYLKLR